MFLYRSRRAWKIVIHIMVVLSVVNSLVESFTHRKFDFVTYLVIWIAQGIALAWLGRAITTMEEKEKHK